MIALSRLVLCPVILMLAVACCGSAVTAVAATVTNASTRNVIPGGKRWLLIVETSSAMQRMKIGTLGSVRDLLEGEMGGQLKPQDTIGVWVFDRETYTGRLPLQRWPASGKDEVVTRIVEFIDSQPFKSASNLQSLMEPLLGIASRSELLTIVMVSSGTGRIAGTPFDREIDEAWFAWSQRQSKRPVITVLRVREGKFIQRSVTPADFAVEMPELPPMTPRVKPKQTAVSTNIAKPKTNLPSSTLGVATSAPVGSLIFSGPNKRETFEPPVVIAGPTNPPAASTGAVSIPSPLPTDMMPGGTQTVVAPSAPRVKPIEGTNPLPLQSTGLVTETTPPVEPIAEPREPKTNIASTTVVEQRTNLPATSSALPAQAGEVMNTSAAPARPTPPQASPRKPWLAAGAIALILAAAGLFLWQRGRSRSHVSLISESVEKDRKNEMPEP